MIAADPDRPPPSDASERGALDVARALLNILEDSASEKEQLRDAQSAVLNILEDFAEEKTRLEEMKKAVLNILEDLALEKSRLEETQKEVLKSEEALRSSLREKETLLREIHHRVKNNLQVIASLLRLQSRYLRDEHARTFFDESQSRVHSISLVHEMLYQAGDLARVDFGEYLRTLTKHLVDGWRGTASSIDVRVEASGVQLAVDTAIPCGLIVTELLTNALKHAFPKRASGTIQVKANQTSGGRVTFTVQDNGVGLPANFDLHRSGSLELELVATLVRQLRAEIAIRSDAGTSFEIGFQIPAN